MVMASGWLLFDRQFEPYRARLRWRPRGVAWDAVPESMVEYIRAIYTYDIVSYKEYISYTIS
jgi:hypothetical protein